MKEKRIHPLGLRVARVITILFLICFKCRLFARYRRVLNVNQTIKKRHFSKRKKRQKHNQPSNRAILCAAQFCLVWFGSVLEHFGIDRFKNATFERKEKREWCLMCLAWIHWTFMLSYWLVTARHKLFFLKIKPYRREKRKRNIYMQKNVYALNSWLSRVRWMSRFVHVNWSLFYFNFMMLLVKNFLRIVRALRFYFVICYLAISAD